MRSVDGLLSGAWTAHGEREQLRENPVQARASTPLESDWAAAGDVRSQSSGEAASHRTAHRERSHRPPLLTSAFVQSDCFFPFSFSLQARSRQKRNSPTGRSEQHREAKQVRERSEV